jgi:hypothetical protein
MAKMAFCDKVCLDLIGASDARAGQPGVVCVAKPSSEMGLVS